MAVTGFRVLLRLHIRAGMEREFEQAWLAADGDLVHQPASLGRWLLRSSTDAGVYYIMSDWVDEEGFRRFESSAVHLAHRAKLHPYRSAGSFDTMQVVFHIVGAAATQVSP